MPRPSEQTLEERRAEGLLLKEELCAANREDAWLFRQQAFLFGANEEELREEFSDDEVESTLGYRRADFTRSAST